MQSGGRPVWNARFRLASLWLSQAARVMADSCLRIVVVLGLLHGDASLGVDAWHLAIAVLAAPAILLAPLNGAIINSLPKLLVLVTAALMALAGGVMLLTSAGNVLCWWGLVALAIGLYWPSLEAIFPAAAKDARVSLPRVNGWMAMGAMLAAAGGLLFGYFGDENPWLMVAAAGILAVVAALPATFPSDLRRAESPLAALASFFGDCRRVFHIAEARGCLIGLALLRGILCGLSAVLVGLILEDRYYLRILGMAWAALIGLAVGSWLAGLNPHPRRVQGLAVLGAAGLALSLVALCVGLAAGEISCFVVGFMAGLINVPLCATYQAVVPADARGNAMALRHATDNLGMLLVTGLLCGLTRAEVLDIQGQFWLLTGITLLAAALCCWWFFRELLEVFVEFLLWPMQRIRAHGPGLDELPAQGPLIVLANHSAYLDPMWVAKVVPRRLIPMMTSAFFDLPVVRWLMVNVAHTIRVPAGKFRREVPEIKEAIAVLDRGDALLVFPEGMLRRKEEQVLRQFGQGIWHILRERPHTPILVCWIEGGWGSYFSYCNGPPTKNKRFDIRRRVDIGVNTPVVLDAAVLEHHRTTRNFLMQACLDARRHLGLEPLTVDKASDNQRDDEPE
ncbi:MAG: hypothetical protein FJ271_27985 [Planctomycetes bacterium]|nr:hypothetical protein [Planctomycetota bacterium]